MTPEITDPKFKAIAEAIRKDPENASFTKRGIDPLFFAGPECRIMIVGQAPGRVAEESGIVWNDRSGDRLRDWMGIDRDTFYNSGKLAIVPMDFYFPGTGKSGDLPPRKDFADKWSARAHARSEAHYSDRFLRDKALSAAQVLGLAHAGRQGLPRLPAGVFPARTPIAS